MTMIGSSFLGRTFLFVLYPNHGWRGFSSTASEYKDVWFVFKFSVFVKLFRSRFDNMYRRLMGTATDSNVTPHLSPPPPALLPAFLPAYVFIYQLVRCPSSWWYPLMTTCWHQKHTRTSLGCIEMWAARMYVALIVLLFFPIANGQLLWGCWGDFQPHLRKLSASVYVCEVFLRKFAAAPIRLPSLSIIDTFGTKNRVLDFRNNKPSVLQLRWCDRGCCADWVFY